ncbi:MAG TPA: pyrroloquinoline quinone biosynthesis peptide chaperone PqqD [Candidatus Binatia bacterium]|nr:pyrroloquinoline quinone biosynthesis peptide chaperone PqqD [Candidatus Binatia bacterium]
MADDSTIWKPRLSSKARLRWDKVEKRHMLVFPEAALLLNETAAEILKLCDGERTIEQIVATLAQQFVGADRTVIADEVTDLLTRLRTRGLLEV